MLIAGTKPGDRWYRERLLLKSADKERRRFAINEEKRIADAPEAPASRAYRCI